MKLEEDGKYYYEVEPKRELKKEDYKSIRDMMFRVRGSIIHTEIISDKKFYFEFIERYVYVYTDDKDKKDKIKISYSPGQIEFKTKNKTEIRYIFSLEQYYKTLDYFGIKFPWSNNIDLNNENIKELIYHNSFIKQPVTIEDITTFDLNLYNEKKNNSKFYYFEDIKTFKDLSKFVKYYLKEDIEINKYEEKDFININDYIITPDSKFEIYNLFERTYFYDSKKEYFFTGPNSIGKTINLLLLSNFNFKNSRNAYYNLKALENNKKYFEMIVYESRHLFDNNQEWENAFRRIVKEAGRYEYNIINELIKICGEKADESNIKYCFILDEITFDKRGENAIIENLDKIRKSISKTNNCFLIGCCSINNEGVRDVLLHQRFSYNEKYKLNLDVKSGYISLYDETKEKSKGDKYLKILGNLPKYLNFKDLLNMKILNLIKKKIKKDIIKFYNSDIYKLSISDLENIDVNKSYQYIDSFKNFLEKIPTQYSLLIITISKLIMLFH